MINFNNKKIFKYIGDSFWVIIFIPVFIMSFILIFYAIGISIKVPIKSVATSNEYKEFIGKSCSLKRDFEVIGIRNDDNIKEVSFYRIYPINSGSHMGREIIYRGEMPKQALSL